MNPALAERLAELGIIAPERQAALAGVHPTPWWLAMLLAVAAWVASLIIMGSFFAPLLALGDGPGMRGFGGLVLLATALWLFRRAGPFFEQMGLAFSLAGQGLMCSALLDGHAAWQSASDSLALTALVIALAMLVPRSSGAHRTLCVLIVLAALGWLLGPGLNLALYGVVLSALATALWLARADWAGLAYAGHLKPLAHGATLAALCLAAYGGAYFGSVEATWLGPARAAYLPWVYSGGASLVFLASVAWLSRAGLPARRILYLAAALLLVLAAQRTPGLMVAAALLLASFHAGHRPWVGLTLLSALVYLGELYYHLEFSLLAKSLALMATGAGLLAARYVVIKLEGAPR